MEGTPNIKKGAQRNVVFKKQSRSKSRTKATYSAFPLGSACPNIGKFSANWYGACLYEFATEIDESIEGTKLSRWVPYKTCRTIIATRGNKHSASISETMIADRPVLTEPNGVRLRSSEELSRKTMPISATNANCSGCTICRSASVGERPNTQVLKVTKNIAQTSTATPLFWRSSR